MHFLAIRELPPGPRRALTHLDLAETYLDRLSDAQSSIRVNYKGLLPDLFREGQGIVAEGALDPAGIFKADTVLAKHDENYMPREVADTLKKQGHWQGEANASPQTQ